MDQSCCWSRRLATVGVLHTMVPDHWVPITLIARQRGWSKSETARAALQAGIGHVLSTLFIALVVWLAGVAFAQRFGHVVDTVSSLALIAFAAGLPFPHGAICESTAGTGTVIAMTFLISMEVRRGTTMIDMTTASTITMNTTTKRHWRMIRFMHRCAVKRLSSRAMSTRTATGKGPSIDIGMITRRIRPTQ